MKEIIALAIITSLAASGTAFARDGSGGAGSAGSGESDRSLSGDYSDPQAAVIILIGNLLAKAKEDEAAVKRGPALSVQPQDNR